ncbi:UNVERIFIED_CONTAM: hypothetical protein RMT77_001790 [Armadillidium vulgare]
MKSLLVFRLLILIFLMICHSFQEGVNGEAGHVPGGDKRRISGCPDIFHNKCQCRRQPYPHHESEEQFVVNCTNSRFTDTTMLEYLPEETEVLIFTGNMLNELEDNIFDFNIDHKNLKYIDFSNNHITFIRGQTFHRVKNVETLILNFNDLEITDHYQRNRIFSNFNNLKYLHLTDAFTDRYNASAYYMLSLQDIFIESNLTKLERLHLEQNEIFTIGSNASIFCPLKSLKHLYLSDNKLSDIEFEIDCLKDLNHIDVRYNMISRLSHDAMERLNKFVGVGNPISVNLKDNPLVCDCRSRDFLEWLLKCSIKMDSIESYICTDGFPRSVVNENIVKVDLQEISCPGLGSKYSSDTVGFLSFLIVFMLIVLVVFGFYHKKRLATLVQPLVNDLTRKVGYRGLAHEETPAEVNV